MRSKTSFISAVPSYERSPLPPSWPVRIGCCMEGTSGAAATMSPGRWTRPLEPVTINPKTSK